MKQIKLMKTLLVAVGLLMGTSVWAESYLTTMTGQVGLTDCTGGLGDYRSKLITLAAGESYEYTLVNHNSGSASYYENWLIQVTGNGYAVFRADGGSWGDTYERVDADGAYQNVTDFANAYNGATVTLNVSRSADGATVTITHTSDVKTTSDTYYGGTYTVTVGTSDAITFSIYNEKSYQIINKVVYTDASGNTTYSFNSSESAYVSAYNSTTNYNGSNVDNLILYYTQYRDWSSGSDGSMKFWYNTESQNSCLPLYKFDLSTIKALENITSIDFSVYGYSSQSSAVSNVRLLGYNPTWDASTITYASGFTNDGSTETLTGTVAGAGSFQPLNDTDKYSIAQAGTTLTANALTYVLSAISADNDYVSFAVAANHGRIAYMNVGADLTIACSAATVYNVTFSETHGADITVMIDDEDVTSGVSLADGTYNFTATATGYNDYNGSFTVDGEDINVEFTMTAKSTFTYTVNAVDAEENVLQAGIASATKYEGETASVAWSKYVNIDGTWYVTSETTFTATATEAGTKNVVYAPSDITYFFEIENMTANRGNQVQATGSGYSGGVSQRHYGASGRTSYYYTTALSAGIYTVSIANTMYNKSGTELSLRTRTAGGVMSDAIVTQTFDTNKTYTFENIVIPEGSSFVIYSANEFNSNALLDYVTLTRTGISGTLANTYSTLASAYGLDFANATVSEGTLTAYVVTKTTQDAVTLTSVDELPAEGGVILKGTAGATYSIPVKADAAYAGTNLLSPAVEATAIDANEAYILQGGEFCLVTAASTVPAGKAYLLASKVPSSAHALGFVFEDETTGINIVESEKMNVEGYYNLAGQRVAQPTKGLYIVNGKKVVLK